MASHKAPRDTGRTILIQLVRLVCGLAVLAALAGITTVGWQYWGVGLDSDTVTRQLEKGVTDRRTVATPDKVARLRTTDIPVMPGAGEGQLLGWLRIPSWGVDWRRAIQEGTDETVLANMGIGHERDTALPGAEGNSFMAGHRTPADLGSLKNLRTGDHVIVESTDTWWVYSVTRDPFVVPQTRTSVMDAGAAGPGRNMTLMTCTYAVGHSKHRWIVQSRLVGWAPKADGVPADLAGTRRTTVERVHRAVSQVSEKINAPVTGVLAVSLAVIWAALDGLAWLVWHGRRPRGRFDLNPLTWLWRLQAGPTPIRVILLTLMGTAGVFAMFRWACPWLTQTIPWLNAGLGDPAM